jgi:hypothetical protein
VIRGVLRLFRKALIFWRMPSQQHGHISLLDASLLLAGLLLRLRR